MALFKLPVVIVITAICILNIQAEDSVSSIVQNSQINPGQSIVVNDVTYKMKINHNQNTADDENNRNDTNKNEVNGEMHQNNIHQDSQGKPGQSTDVNDVTYKMKINHNQNTTDDENNRNDTNKNEVNGEMHQNNIHQDSQGKPGQSTDVNDVTYKMKINHNQNTTDDENNTNDTNKNDVNGEMHQNNIHQDSQGNPGQSIHVNDDTYKMKINHNQNTADDENNRNDTNKNEVNGEMHQNNIHQDSQGKPGQSTDDNDDTYKMKIKHNQNTLKDENNSDNQRSSAVENSTEDPQPSTSDKTNSQPSLSFNNLLLCSSVMFLGICL